MIYVKSLLVGLLVVFGSLLSLLVLVVVGVIAYNAVHPGLEGTAIGWDPISLNRPVVWCIITLIFCAGFFWEYRRLAR